MTTARLRRPDDAPPLLYAHRGSCRRAPENSLRAFELALAEGADGIELDVRLSRNGAVVVCHDPTFERVADNALVVADATVEELRAVDLGDGERPALLDEVLDFCAGTGLRLNVELKGDLDRAGLVAAIVGPLMRRADFPLFVSSFHPGMLVGLRRAGVARPCAFLFDAEHTGRARAAVLNRLLPSDGVHPHHPLATAPAVRRWRARGRFINAWTADDDDDVRRLAAAGVDGIITNDVVAARSALEWQRSGAG